MCSRPALPLWHFSDGTPLILYSRAIFERLACDQLFVVWLRLGMSFWKRWLGSWWSGQSGEDEEQQQQQQATASQRRPHAHRRREDPLIQDAHGEEGGGVQGLGWYQHSMLRDEDGDVAHGFLEESTRAKREGLSPEHKRQKASLQNSERQLKPVGPADMLVDQGNVYVVPRDDS